MGQSGLHVRFDHANEIGADAIEIFDSSVMGEVSGLGSPRKNAADGIDELIGIELRWTRRRHRERTALDIEDAIRQAERVAGEH